MNDNCSATRDLLPQSFLVATQCERDISLTRVIGVSAAFEWEAAWRAIKQDRHLKEFFERLYPKTGKKKAIVAVARKFIGRIRAAFRHQTSYQINPLIPEVAQTG